MADGQFVWSVAKNDIEALHSGLQQTFPTHTLSIRKVLGLKPEFLDLLVCGAKTTTIRYSPPEGSSSAIHCPAATVLPLALSSSNESVGKVTILKVEVKPYSQLTDEDGQRDGFSGLDELCKVLKAIYGTINATDLVTIYTLAYQTD
jgi:hypothetical protein